MIRICPISVSFSASSPSSCQTDKPEALLQQVSRALDLLAGEAKTLGLAVSGGSDSLAMMVLACHWARSRSVCLRVVCLNHGLRAEAAQEAAMVDWQAAQYGLDCDIIQGEMTGKPLSQNRLRGVRHRQLAEWARGHGLSLLALGHTADDRIETLLIRLRAESKSYGLAAPVPRAISPTWPQGRGIYLIRPLLGIRRKALQDWLEQQGLSWCSDPSNENRQFERVRVRQEIATLPDEKLQSLFSCANSLLRKRARTMRRLRRIIHKQLIWHPDGSVRLPAACWNRLKTGIRARLIQILCQSVSGRMYAPRMHDCDSLIARMNNPETHTDTLGGVWFVKEDCAMGLAPVPEGWARTRNARPAEVLLCEGAGKILWDARFELHLETESVPVQILSQDAARARGYSKKISRPCFRLAPGLPVQSEPTRAHSALARMAGRSCPVLLDPVLLDQILIAPEDNPAHKDRPPVSCQTYALHAERALSLVAAPVAKAVWALKS